MLENTILMTLGSLQVTVYSLCILIGAILAVLVTLCLGVKRHGADAMLRLCVWTVPCAMIGSHLVFCLARMSVLLTDYQHGAALMVMPWMGGYTLSGSFLGGMLGVYLSDRKHFGIMADAAMPGAMLILAVARAAECFIQEGIGPYIEEESLFFFPVGICTYPDEEWPEWQLAVFAWEALAAIALFVLAIVLLRKGSRPGATAEIILALMCTAQLLFESLRCDEVIKFGFVRFNQLMAAIALLGIMVIRMIRYSSGKTWQIIRSVLFVLGIGGIIAIEFALDKSPIDNRILYGVMILMQVMIGFAVLLEKKGKKGA